GVERDLVAEVQLDGARVLHSSPDVVGHHAHDVDAVDVAHSYAPGGCGHRSLLARERGGRFLLVARCASVAGGRTTTEAGLRRRARPGCSGGGLGAAPANG